MNFIRRFWQRVFGAGSCVCRSCDCNTLMTTAAAVCSFCRGGEHRTDIPHHLYNIVMMTEYGVTAHEAACSLLWWGRCLRWLEEQWAGLFWMDPVQGVAWDG